MSLPRKLINPRKSEDFTPHELTVRLLDGSNRLPSTPVEKLAITTLKDRGPTPFPALVERVAHEVYRNEIRNGGWILDLGLFGSRLFTRDVTRELKAGDGIFWEIQQGSGTA